MNLKQSDKSVKELIAELGIRHSYFKDFVYGAIDGTVTTMGIKKRLDISLQI